MIKKTLLSTIIFLSVLSCIGQNTSLENEIELWKKELVDSGQLGEPCKDDWKKWIEENPGNVFGISDELNIKKSDYNNDGIDDAFVIMDIGDPCNDGNAISSDYSVLIYSKNGNYLRNESVTEKIEKELNDKLSTENEFNISRLITSLKSFDKTINGSSFIHLENDASCCPSYRVNFSYNIKTEKVTTELIKNE